MKIQVKANLLRIIYERAEWELISRKFEELGLQIGESANAFGSGQRGVRFYRETSNELLNAFRNSAHNNGFISDFNQPPISGDCFNLAIFRAIPTPTEGEKLVTELRLNTLMTLRELDLLLTKIPIALEFLLSIVGEREININLEIRRGR